MSYFRNKFDKEFLFLCNEQTPKGGAVRLDYNTGFWIFRKKGISTSLSTIEVIPLLLYNKIYSSNQDKDENGEFVDKNVEDYMMICANKSDTTVTCEYDPFHTGEHSKDFVCQMGITNLTGDLNGEE